MNEGMRAAELYTLLVFTKISAGFQYLLALTSDQHLTQLHGNKASMSYISQIWSAAKLKNLAFLLLI